VLGSIGDFVSDSNTVHMVRTIFLHGIDEGSNILVDAGSGVGNRPLNPDANEDGHPVFFGRSGGAVKGSATIISINPEPLVPIFLGIGDDGIPLAIASTLAIRIETGNVDAIEVVGGENGVREEEEGRKRS